jgi:hypothetical protein
MRKKQSMRAAQGHHGAEGGRGHKKPLTQDSESEVSKRDAGIAPIHYMVAAAVAAGWPVRGAFEASMQLLLHGVSVQEAREMFLRCEEWRQ